MAVLLKEDKKGDYYVAINYPGDITGHKGGGGPGLAGIHIHPSLGLQTNKHAAHWPNNPQQAAREITGQGILTEPRPPEASGLAVKFHGWAVPCSLGISNRL